MSTQSLFERSTFRVLGLAVFTLALVIAAVLAVQGEASKVAAAFDPYPMFEDLDASQAVRLTIRSSEGEVEVTLNDRGDWVIPARSGYPARPGPLLQTVGGLTELELIEAKTSRADWHHFLGLEAPEAGGGGVEIKLFDASGDELAAVIVGSQPEGAATELDGRGRIHVRRPGEDQTWLARGTLSLHTDLTEWLATRLYEIDGERFAQVEVRAPNSDPYTLVRDTTGATDFELIDLPVGREILSPYVLEAIGTAPSEMEVLDVRPAAQVDLSDGHHLIYKTFDGLELEFLIADPEGPDGGWATIEARYLGLPDASDEEAVQGLEEAADINVLADGWAFALPGFQARQMILDLDDLLRPEAESVQ